MGPSRRADLKRRSCLNRLVINRVVQLVVLSRRVEEAVEEPNATSGNKQAGQHC